MKGDCGAMTGKEIYEASHQLQRDLLIALETFERKDNIQRLREQLVQYQNACPHYDEELNWNYVEGHCPYCGRKIER